MMLENFEKKWVVMHVLEVVSNCKKVILYGSRVNNPDGNDIDIRAIVSKKDLDKYEWADYQSKIDCNVLDEGWNFHEAPKIDLKVMDHENIKLPRETLWEAYK